MRQTIDNSLGSIDKAVNLYVQLSHPNAGYSCTLTEGVLAFTYNFSYLLEGWEIVLFRDIGILPRPAGISYNITWVV